MIILPLVGNKNTLVHNRNRRFIFDGITQKRYISAIQLFGLIWTTTCRMARHRFIALTTSDHHRPGHFYCKPGNFISNQGRPRSLISADLDDYELGLATRVPAMIEKSHDLAMARK